MNIHVLPAGPIETNAYLLTEPARGEAVLIDAPGDVWAEVEPILRKEKCQLVELWLTHGHWDHMQGGAEVVRATGARVRAHAADRPMIETPEIMKRFLMPGQELEPVKVDAWVKQGEIISALGTTAEVRHVPGHCPGNVLFYFAPTGAPANLSAVASATAEASAKQGVAFVGDALFAGSVGRTDLPGGDFAILEKSIRSQIYTLPDATKVFPGHGPDTTVGEEKRSNPYVSG
jgi:hydroxyacylglutathione hydrolase